MIGFAGKIYVNLENVTIPMSGNPAKRRHTMAGSPNRGAVGTPDARLSGLCGCSFSWPATPSIAARRGSISPLSR